MSNKCKMSFSVFRKMSGTQLQATANHYRPNIGSGSYRPSSGLHSMDTDDSDGLDVVGLDDHHHRSHHDSHPRFGSGKSVVIKINEFIEHYFAEYNQE